MAEKNHQPTTSRRHFLKSVGIGITGIVGGTLVSDTAAAANSWIPGDMRVHHYDGEWKYQVFTTRSLPEQSRDKPFVQTKTNLSNDEISRAGNGVVGQIGGPGDGTLDSYHFPDIPYRISAGLESDGWGMEISFGSYTQGAAGAGVGAGMFGTNSTAVIRDISTTPPRYKYEFSIFGDLAPGWAVDESNIIGPGTATGTTPLEGGHKYFAYGPIKELVVYNPETGQKGIRFEFEPDDMTDIQSKFVPAINGVFPRDINGDGLREDINANGEVGFPDVNAFFQHSGTSLVRNWKGAYDFNRDGNINLQDVMALFQMV